MRILGQDPQVKANTIYPIIKFFLNVYFKQPFYVFLLWFLGTQKKSIKRKVLKNSDIGSKSRNNTSSDVGTTRETEISFCEEPRSDSEELPEKIGIKTCSSGNIFN